MGVPAAHVTTWHVQECLRKVVKGVGGFGHAQWRAFQNEHSRAECKGFVDGDLIEQVMPPCCWEVSMRACSPAAL